ncbi:hypothetical protein BC830DRAFT_1126396 [Chytriomyces sp. MP71]|nr:hypothetical protein BC830DRAFT_1126396 [Chytriomyces sp. MP71]
MGLASRAQKSNVQSFAAFTGSVIGIYTLVKAARNLGSAQALDAYMEDVVAAAAAEEVARRSPEQLETTDNSNDETRSAELGSVLSDSQETVVPANVNGIHPDAARDLTRKLCGNVRALRRRATRTRRLVVYLKPTSIPLHCEKCCNHVPDSSGCAREGRQKEVNGASLTKAVAIFPASPHFLMFAPQTVNKSRSNTTDQEMILQIFLRVILGVVLLVVAAITVRQSHLGNLMGRTRFEQIAWQSADAWCVVNCARHRLLDEIPI